MATTEEQIRLLIADGGDTPHYTSGQIAVFVSLAAPLGGSVYIAAALALEAWVADLTDNAESETIGDYSISRKQADKKLALATRYRDQASALDDAPACGWASMDLASVGEDTV